MENSFNKNETDIVLTHVWISINLRSQSEYRKVQTRKNSVFGHFSRSDIMMF